MTIGKPPAEESGTFTSVVGENGELQTARVVEGQLFVQRGGCGGNVERGKSAVPLTRFKHEWKARGMRNRVHPTVSACLAPSVVHSEPTPKAIVSADGIPVFLFRRLQKQSRLSSEAIL
jgi:hypothetical protein